MELYIKQVLQFKTECELENIYIQTCVSELARKYINTINNDFESNDILNSANKFKIIHKDALYISNNLEAITFIANKIENRENANNNYFDTCLYIAIMYSLPLEIVRIILCTFADDILLLKKESFLLALIDALQVCHNFDVVNFILLFLKRSLNNSELHIIYQKLFQFLMESDNCKIFGTILFETINNTVLSMLNYKSIFKYIVNNNYSETYIKRIDELSQDILKRNNKSKLLTKFAFTTKPLDNIIRYF
jgi:mannitol/fructose-specific phosphotransferase system IIA component (Ntr-type)